MQGVEWTAICASIPRLDPVRAWLWHSACEALGVFDARLWPFIETPPTHDLMWLPPIPMDATCLVTHGADGEYGHRHHRQVSAWVREAFHGPVITFGGKTGANVVRLKEETAVRKMTALQCYQHEMPYNGETMPKWRALLHRYCEVEGYDFEKETFDVWSD